jgi:hypothetical protein
LPSKEREKRKALRVLLICWLHLLAGAALHAQGGEFALITNQQNPLRDVSMAKLRRLFLGEDRFWKGGLPVILVVREPGSPEHEVMLRRVAGQSGGDYTYRWRQLIFLGTASSEPTIVPSNGLAAGLVASHAGAVAIIAAQNVPKNGAVKVLKVEGKLPGEAGYKLVW